MCAGLMSHHMGGEPPVPEGASPRSTLPECFHHTCMHPSTRVLGRKRWGACPTACTGCVCWFGVEDPWVLGWLRRLGVQACVQTLSGSPL